MKYAFLLVLLIIASAGGLLGGVIAYRWLNDMTQTARIVPGERRLRSWGLNEVSKVRGHHRTPVARVADASAVREELAVAAPANGPRRSVGQRDRPLPCREVEDDELVAVEKGDASFAAGLSSRGRHRERHERQRDGEATHAASILPVWQRPIGARPTPASR